MAWPTHIVAAAGYVFDREGNVLLVKTGRRGWDAPGGQVEEGEDLEQGLIREITEESGIAARVCSLCGIYSNVGSYVYGDGVTRVPTKVMFDFICENESGACRPSEETSDVMWVPKGEVFRYVSSPAVIYRFEKALSFGGRVTYGSYVTKPGFKLLSERYV